MSHQYQGYLYELIEGKEDDEPLLRAVELVLLD